MLRSSTLVLTIWLLFTGSGWAHETGEMLRFDDRVQLSVEIPTGKALRSAGEIVHTWPASATSRAPFNCILMNGMLPDQGFGLQIAIQTGVETWGDWVDTSVKVFESGRFWSRLDIDHRNTHRIRIRIVNRHASKGGSVDIYAVEAVDSETIDSEAKSDDVTGIEPPPFERELTPKAAVAKPPLITRQEWGAQPPDGAYTPHSPYRFTQHHTAGRRIQSLADGLDEMRFIQDFHQNGRGWTDIGYHYCVDDAGRVYEGVPPDYRGTHTGDNNTGNLGISVFGNYQEDGVFPTAATLDSLVGIWSWLASEYDVNPDTLLGHRDYNPTDCPGTNLYAELPNIRAGIRKTLEPGYPYVANPQPQPFSTEVSPISSISIGVRDDEEGVDLSSITLRVNHGVVLPDISGGPDEFILSYQPPEPFPSSQHVAVEVTASDLATPPHLMTYVFDFAIKVEALQVETETANSVLGAELELVGSWESDQLDVDLPGLSEGERLVALDIDGSHRARLFPLVEEEGDYWVYMANSGRYLGESALYRFVSRDGLEHPRIVEYNAVSDSRWGLLSPTPIRFSGEGFGDSYVELSGVSAFDTRMVIDAFRLEKVDRLDPPTAPTIKWSRVTNPGTREVEIAWYPSLEGDIQGYRLFLSLDGTTWTDPIADESLLTSSTASHTVVLEDSTSKAYFRLVAVDTNGFEDEAGFFEPFLSDPTDTYGVGLAPHRRVLVVDNFDRRQSWPLSHHPFAMSHGEAIAEAGIGFDSCSETAVQTGEIHLADYDAVVYLCGDDSRSDESLAAADQYRLLDYLEHGGKLLISGSEIGYDFDSTIPAEQERVRNLLKATYVGDLSGSNHVVGVEGTRFEGLDFVFGTIASEDTYIEDYPDYIRPDGGSLTALAYDNGRIAGVQYSGSFGSGSAHSQLVYLAFPFETIPESSDRASLMLRILQYFRFPTSRRDMPQFDLSSGSQ